MIKIKKSYKEITIDDYINIIDIIEDDSTDELTKNQLLIILLSKTKIDINEIKNMPFKEFKDLIKDLSFLSKQPTTKLKTKYKLNKRKYKLLTSINDFTVDKFNYISNMEFKVENYSKILSAVMIPEDNITDYVLIEKEIKTFMNMEDVLNILFFYQTLNGEYIKHTRTYLEKMKMIKKKK